MRPTLDCISCGRCAHLNEAHLCPTCTAREERGYLWPQGMVDWDPDLDDMLMRLEEGPKMTYKALAHAISVTCAAPVTPAAVQYRLRKLGAPPRKQRGLPIQVHLAHCR